MVPCKGKPASPKNIKHYLFLLKTEGICDFLQNHKTVFIIITVFEELYGYNN